MLHTLVCALVLMSPPRDLLARLSSSAQASRSTGSRTQARVLASSAWTTGAAGRPPDTAEQPKRHPCLAPRRCAATSSLPTRASRCARRRCESSRPRLARIGWRRPTRRDGTSSPRCAPAATTISASKGSYVGVSYGQQRPPDAPKPLADSRQSDGRAPRFHAAARQRHHRPHPRRVRRTAVRRDQIGAQQYQTIQGQRRLVPSGRAGSDQRHRRVPAVRHFAGAVLLCRRRGATNPANAQDKTAYAPMYFPGHRQRRAGAACHDCRRTGGQRHRDGAEADAGNARERHRRRRRTASRWPGSVMVMSTERLRLLLVGWRADASRRRRSPSTVWRPASTRCARSRSACSGTDSEIGDANDHRRPARTSPMSASSPRSHRAVSGRIVDRSGRRRGAAADAAADADRRSTSVRCRWA